MIRWTDFCKKTMVTGVSMKGAVSMKKVHSLIFFYQVRVCWSSEPSFPYHSSPHEGVSLSNRVLRTFLPLLKFLLTMEKIESENVAYCLERTNVKLFFVYCYFYVWYVCMDTKCNFYRLIKIHMVDLAIFRKTRETTRKTKLDSPCSLASSSRRVSCFALKSDREKAHEP